MPPVLGALPESGSDGSRMMEGRRGKGAALGVAPVQQQQQPQHQQRGSSPLRDGGRAAGSKRSLSPRHYRHASIHALPAADAGGDSSFWRQFRRRVERFLYADPGAGPGEQLPLTAHVNGAGAAPSPRLNGHRGGLRPALVQPQGMAANGGGGRHHHQQHQQQQPHPYQHLSSPRSLHSQSPPQHTLPEAYHSIAVPRARPGEPPSWLRRLRTLLAYVGPGYMVAVGYMDPGNWATDIAGGALFNYALLFVVLLSSLLAIFLQVLCVKLGIATKRDLAQMCREAYSPRVATFLWATAEVAIAACDLAEVIGSAIALELLVGLPLVWGCCLTALDVLVVLSLFDQPHRFRFLEFAVMLLILVIFLCFAVEVALSRPSLPGVLEGFFAPDLRGLVTDGPKLYIAMGILGATVMPHNLYLHSSIVQTRDFGETYDDKAEAILYSSLDTVIALGLALFVNAAILIVSAAAFYDPTGKINNGEAPSVAQAYHLLAPILGNKAGSVLFGVALLASGQNSTLTGTLAGQIVMEGFVNVRLKPWLRRLATRLMVVVPAVLTVVLAGQTGVDALLVLSQVILSLQLSFAVIPLIAFTSDIDIMGPHFVNGPLTKAFGWATAGLIAVLNLWLVVVSVAQGGGDVAL